jgi:hypothetical protein
LNLKKDPSKENKGAQYLGPDTPLSQNEEDDEGKGKNFLFNLRNYEVFKNMTENKNSFFFLTLPIGESENNERYREKLNDSCPRCYQSYL